MSLIEELKRRRVFRVVISYAITAWLVLQVADIATESFDAPGWIMQMLFAVLILGFFVAIVLAWAFQMTRSGVVRDTGEASGDGGQRGLVVVVSLLLVLSGVLLWDRFTPDGEAPASAAASGGASVAVLPFANMSTSAENEYFSDGLTDTLLHQLAQVPDLKVAARTSSFAFKNTNTDIREIARTLDVAHVLEGSVQRAGDTVRITAQLIQASDGYHVWSATFDRDLVDIFAVQDEIAAQVASALTGSLLDSTAESVRVDGGTDNPEAYDRYLQAREAFHGGSERSLASSNRLLREAVTLDPNFAIAWSSLAESLIRHAQLAGLGFAEIETEMRSAAERGVELAPESSITVGIKGLMLSELGNNAEGRRYVEQALALDPANVWALSYLSDIQFSQSSFDEAVETASRAMALDPLDFTLKAQSSFKFLQIGRIDEALSLSQAVLDNAPDSFDGLAAMGNVYWRTGQLAEAYRLYYTLVQQHPNTDYIYLRIASIFEELNDWEVAERWIERSTEINERRGRLAMADHCNLAQRKECAISLYRAAQNDWSQDNPDDRQWYLQVSVIIARLEGDWQAVAEISEATREWFLSLHRPWPAAWSALRRAHAAVKLGDPATAEALLSDIEAQVREIEASGSRSQYTYMLESYVMALRADPEATVDALNKAISYGFRNVAQINAAPEFDAVRDDPAVRSVLTDLSASNVEELERVRAVVAEVGGI